MQRRLIFLYDVLEQQVIQRFVRPAKAWVSFLGATISPDGKFVAGTFSDGTLLVWDVATGNPVAQHHIGPFCGVQPMFFGEKLILSGWYLCRDTKIIEPLSGEVLAILPNTIAPVAVTNQFIAGIVPFQENQVAVWNILTWETVGLLELPSEVRALAADPNGKGLYIGATNGVIYFFDFNKWQAEQIFVQASPVLSLTTDPKGLWLAASSRDDRLVVWDLKRKEMLYEIDVRRTLLQHGWLPRPQDLWVETLHVQITSLSQDGANLLLVCTTFMVREIFLVTLEQKGHTSAALP